MSTISAGTTSTTTLVHSGDTTGSLVFKTNDTGSGGTTAVTIDTSQNVGIGTSSPSAKFNIDGASSDAVALFTNTGTLSAGGNGLRLGIDNSLNAYVNNTKAGPLILYTSNAERMRINSSGYVGIGLTSPSAPLNVQAIASNGLSIRVNGRSADNYGELAFWNNANSTNYGTVGADQAAMYIGTNASLPVTFTTAASERMRIDSSGNLLVGNTATPAVGNIGFAFQPSGLMYVTANGDSAVRIKRGSDTGAALRWYGPNSNTEVGNVAVSTTNTTYNTSSDYRLKENIQPMQNGLGVVAQLKPVTYKWKADGSDGQGFIAHELQAVVPECVTGEKDAVDADGNPVYQGIDTSFLVATLTAAIQEQQALITAQAETINALTARVVALEGK